MACTFCLGKCRCHWVRRVRAIPRCRFCRQSRRPSVAAGKRPTVRWSSRLGSVWWSSSWRRICPVPPRQGRSACVHVHHMRQNSKGKNSHLRFHSPFFDYPKNSGLEKVFWWVSVSFSTVHRNFSTVSAGGASQNGGWFTTYTYVLPGKIFKKCKFLKNDFRKCEFLKNDFRKCEFFRKISKTWKKNTLKYLLLWTGWCHEDLDGPEKANILMYSIRHNPWVETVAFPWRVEGANSACGFPFHARFAHAACHCSNPDTVSSQKLCLVQRKHIILWPVVRSSTFYPTLLFSVIILLLVIIVHCILFFCFILFYFISFILFYFISFFLFLFFNF